MLSDAIGYYQILSGKIREGGTPPVGSPGGKLRGGGYPPTRFFLDGRMGGSHLAVTGVMCMLSSALAEDVFNFQFMSIRILLMS